MRGATNANHTAQTFSHYNWEFFRGYATHDSADLYSRIELVERDWEDLSERVLARLELGERY